MADQKNVNPCAKHRKVNNPYEVWQSTDGSWTYQVLKKNQRPELEARNPYAIWNCACRSPFELDLAGHDTYRKDILLHTLRVWAEVDGLPLPDELKFDERW